VSTRQSLNQSRLPVTPATPVAPMEVVVTNTESVADTTGSSDTTTLLTRDEYVIEAITHLTERLDALTELVRAIFAE
jgi:hypothetical protein